MKSFWRVLMCLIVFVVSSVRAAGPDGVQSLELTVNGVPRTALVYLPRIEPGKTVPLVFVFHGHGGSSANALGGFGINRLWPEAISVYPQGLDTPGQISDPEGKLPGWQAADGDQGNRDLLFFDALLARLKKDYPVDPQRIYVTGHSNGAGFTYLLWHTRADVFAAVAPCSGAARYVADLTPKPAIILGGREDHTVKFEWQQKMIDVVQRIDGCDPAGVPWQGGAGTLYASKTGTPLVTYLYDGGHAMEGGEARWVVQFFKEHPAP